MNVLVVAYSVDKNDISESQMAYEWISRLRTHATLWVVTTGSRLHNSTGLEGLDGVNLVTIRPRLSFKRFDSFDRAVHPGYIEFYMRARPVIKSILRDHKIDLCHHLSPQSPRFPSPVRGCGIPYVVGPIHGGVKPPPVMDELDGKEDAFFALRKLDEIRNRWDFLLKRTFANAAAAVVSAPYAGAVPPACYCALRPVIPGIAITLPRECRDHGSTQGEVRLIYAGRLVPSKGLELLIEALSRCETRNTRLSIFGTGEQGEWYRNLAVERGVDERIEWRGFVPREEILNEFLKSDVFVFPSLKEAMGTVVMEAMAAGLPVICVDHGGPGYLVTDDTGIKIQIADKERMIDELAAAIDRLVSNQGMRLQMGQNSRQRAEQKFTWNSIVGQMIELYQDFA